MVTHMHYQTIVQFRVPISDDGTPGTPEIINRFTTAWKGTQNLQKKKAPKPKKKVKEQAQVNKMGEVDLL